MKNMNDLYAFLAKDIPKGKVYDVGFLEMIGKAHDENINSRVYAYFLNPANNNELAMLFLTALLNLIQRKLDKEIDLIEWRVNTEEVTRKGNRIDIVIHDVLNERAILIENKIFHILNNDLIDYWEHLELQDNNQVGVILTLEKHSVPQEVIGKFLNITHSEWCSEIRSLGLPSGLHPKIYSYLNDFFNTVENLTNSTEMNDQAKFFFQNAVKVKEITATYEEGKKYIENQIEQLADMLGWTTYGNSYGLRNIWDKDRKCDVFYTLEYNDLLEGGNKIKVIIELNRDPRKRDSEAYQLVQGDEYFASMKRGKGNSNYIYFGYKDFELSMVQISDLSNHLFLKIQTEFEPVMKKLLHHFYPKHY